MNLLKKIIEEEAARELSAGAEIVAPETGEIAREIATKVSKRLDMFTLRVALIELEGDLPKNDPSPATLADVDAIFSSDDASSPWHWRNNVKRKVAELLETYKRDRNWSDTTLYDSQAHAQRMMFRIAELERRVAVAEGRAASKAATGPSLAPLRAMFAKVMEHPEHAQKVDEAMRSLIRVFAELGLVEEMGEYLGLDITTLLWEPAVR